MDELTRDADPREDANTLRRRLHDANVTGGVIDLDERERQAHIKRRFWMGRPPGSARRG